ncbi:hypothetical protein DFH06DRAFT_1343970 [Mycena polygramma]|nr:hypothetical protein DFH06DRAFT_1343970 [Mycena polygramma]
MSAPFAPTATALGIRDSQLAAVIEDGSYFITSPNAERILAPALGPTRLLHLRQDGLWGDDDPIQWPQIFVPDYCHFSSIPAPPQTVEARQTNANILALWYNPTREQFICPASGQSILRGCGKLPFSVLKRLRGVLERVQTQFQSFTSCPKIPPLLPHLMQTAICALSRLEVLPTGYMELLLTVRAFQRSLLEAIAVMDYIKVYQPRMAGLTRSTGVDLRMGTFTADPRTVEDHVAAGLKVWFIQPSSAFRFQNILEIAPLVAPENVIQMALVNTDARPTFIGSHSKKFECIHHITRKISYTPDPFNDTPVESAAGPTRHQGQSCFLPSPYSKEPTNPRNLVHHSNNSAAGRNKFLPIDSPYMPDYIPGWKKALASVNAFRPTRPRSLADAKYLFPDIALFCTAASDDRKARYFATWAYMRTALIYRVFGTTVGSDSAEPLSAQDWRDILNGGLFKLEAGSRTLTLPSA